MRRSAAAPNAIQTMYSYPSVQGPVPHQFPSTLPTALPAAPAGPGSRATRLSHGVFDEGPEITKVVDIDQLSFASSALGQEVEQNFSLVLEKLGLAFKQNQVFKRTEGLWQITDEFDNKLKQRQKLIEDLRNNPDMEWGSVPPDSYMQQLVQAAQSTRDRKRCASAIMGVKPWSKSVVAFEVDFVVSGPKSDCEPMDIPIQLARIQDPPAVDWTEIRTLCQNGALIEVTAQPWQQHKPESCTWTWLVEAQQCKFPSGHSLYFFNGFDGAKLAKHRCIHVFWYNRKHLLSFPATLERLRQIEDLRRVIEEQSLLPRQHLRLSGSGTIVWVRELIHKDSAV
ncbi:unnamed protein product [Symbiodinium necroappetens]|uniref:Uncharacterized protein n=1 Tax=Symbiodinium necroappetens TaxID=1628268 RepID=A0A813A8H4_9DINO|nr:unnamed protein product [Symbiodinium necroappetens]